MKHSGLSFLDEVVCDIEALERDAGRAYLAFADASRRAALLDMLRADPPRAAALADRMLLGHDLRLLPYQSPTVIATAVAALALAGGNARVRLVALTKGPPCGALHARLALHAIGDSKAAKAPDSGALIARVGEGKPKERVMAIAQLARLGAPDSLPALRAALDGGHPSVRHEAARTLGLLGDAEAFDCLSARFEARPATPPANIRGAVPVAIADALSAYDGLVRLGDARAIASIVALARERSYVGFVGKIAEAPPVDALVDMQPVGVAGLAELALENEHVLERPLYVTQMQDEFCEAAVSSILAKWLEHGPAASRKRRAAIVERICE